MDQRLLSKLEGIVLQNLDNEQFGVNDLAEMVAMSRFQVHRRLHKIRGQSISQFIREIRLKKALELLDNEEITASEVAFKVGFSSTTYFNKCFSDYFGVTPGKIKKSEFVFSGFTQQNGGESAHPAPDISQKYQTRNNSIVVLPFVNLSKDPDQEYFCDGITEEIINALGLLSNLKVIGRSTSFQFKNVERSHRDIAKALNISNILEGSMRIYGNMIRITVRLVDARSGYLVWSKKYDNQFHNALEIQDEIAHEVSRELNITFTPSNTFNQKLKRHTNHIEAYQQYFKGRSLFYKRGRCLYDAVLCFKKALDIDNKYALAYSGLADTYVMLMFHGYVSPRKFWPIAIEASQKALKYGPDLAETINSIAIIALFYEWNWKKAEANFKRSIEINPVYIQAYCWYGLFYLVFLKNDIQEGIRQASIAAEIDPLSSYAQTILCWSYAVKEDFTNGIAHGLEGKEIDPNSISPYLCMGQAYVWNKEFKKAIKNFEKSMIQGLGSFWYYPWTMAYLQGGLNEKASILYKKMQREFERGELIPTCLASLNAFIGRFDKATHYFRIACNIRDPIVTCFANTHDDNRYLRLIPNYKAILREHGFDHHFKERFG